MVRNEFTFPSADGKTAIHAVEWLPEGDVRAVLQISHGVSEYILRYEPFAAWLTNRGFAVVGHDHLGHGGSVAPGSARLYFGPKGSWNWVVEDIYTRRSLAGRRFPGVPYFLLGHSMGSFLARTYLIRYPGTVDGAVIMGTGHMPSAVVTAGQLFVRREIRRVGETCPSDAVTKLSFGTYNRAFAPNRTGFDWLSADPENVDRYIADPLCGADATVGLFRDMLGGIRFNQKPANLKKMDTSMPVLFIAGEDDPVGAMGKGVKRSCAAFQKAGMQDVTLKLYPGLRHEILNEKPMQQTVYADIHDWLSRYI